MPVKQRGGGYQADLNHNGRRWRFAFDTEDAANGWLADAKAAIANGRPVPEPSAVVHGAKPGTLTLVKACEQCWNHVYAGNKSDWPKTALLHMKAIKNFFPHTTIDEVSTQEKADEYAAHLYSLKQAQSTINAKLSVYSMLMRWAFERRLIKEKPRVVRRKPNNERASFLSEEDEANVLRLLRQWEMYDAADAVVVLVDTGLRPSEMLRLVGTDYLEGKIVVRQSKNGETRTVVGTQRVREIMQRRVKAYGSDRLFTNLTMRRLQLQWDKAREVMGRNDDPDFVPYILRHTCASRLVQRGVPLSVVMRWMGHKSMQITMRYAKHASADFEDAAAALEAGPRRNLRVVGSNTESGV